MSDRNWLWAARGKHPSAKDYFSIGCKLPLASNFSEWIEKGYPLLDERRSHAEACSWRFWARGTMKNEISCGLVRDSHDSLGRQYPLLIIGTGRIADWEEQWDKLPSACERAWRQMEYISMQKFNKIAHLETEMLRIPPPCAELSDPPVMDSARREPARLSRQDVMISECRKSGPDIFSEDEMGIIELGSEVSFDSLSMMLHVNSLLKGRLNKTPNALFMGGTFNRSYLVYFSRPMKTADFTYLWSADRGCPTIQTAGR